MTTETVLPDVLPILPLRDTVAFPMAVIPLIIGQERSVKLVEDVMRADRLIALVAQRRLEARPAGPDDLYRVGTAAVIQQLLRAPDGTLRLIVQGMERIRISDFTLTEPYLVGRIERLPESTEAGVEAEALIRAVRDLVHRLGSLIPEFPEELEAALKVLGDPRQIAYLTATGVPLPVAARQEVLEIDPVEPKLKRLVEILQHELAVHELGRKITRETEEEMSKAQRDYFLREQLKTIQRQLGEESPEQAEVRAFRRKLEEMPLPEEVRSEAERELSRLERLPPAAAEYGLIRTYLDWLFTLPWGKTTGERIDVPHARKILDEDHYDLDKIKDRILEYLAVRKLREERKIGVRPAALQQGPEGSENGAATRPTRQSVDDEGRREPILCFVGPPGVGKTSLGQSIARAMGRKFIRISLGGVHDEAEIRGHRRTYIGAMPGRIVQALRRAEAFDPVLMLDEVDKLGVGFQGDPAAGLLEVLDPAQNHAFVDTYLGVPIDLTGVLFLCTANTTDTIPSALQDRMELVFLSGYTEEEKVHIFQRYLLKRQLRAHGLLENEIVIEEGAIRRVIRDYTREAGVRGLERSLAGILRKVARRISEGAPMPITVGEGNVNDYLGRPKYLNEMAERIDRPGVATGLAWTPTGGDILFVEATMMPSHDERLILTGMLGDVMRESAQAALSYLRSNAERLGIGSKVFEGRAIHIHVPAGAIPKDGPSAGVTMMVALGSLASGRPVRNDVAMTGEITLRGKVLPVGGIKEKVLAAYRAGVKVILLPKRNEDALEEIPEEIKRSLTFHLIDSAEEVFKYALMAESTHKPAPVLTSS
ncbi:MAG: endopeptidase La [Candidatus Manganitrophaceae bacterium]